MSYREFLEWQMYFKKEPFGPQQEDLRAGVIAAAVINVNRDKSNAVQPWDVMRTLEPPPEVQEDPHAPEVVSKNVISFFSRLKIA